MLYFFKNLSESSELARIVSKNSLKAKKPVTSGGC